MNTNEDKHWLINDKASVKRKRRMLWGWEASYSDSRGPLKEMTLSWYLKGKT